MRQPSTMRLVLSIAFACVAWLCPQSVLADAKQVEIAHKQIDQAMAASAKDSNLSNGSNLIEMTDQAASSMKAAIADLDSTQLQEVKADLANLGQLYQNQNKPQLSLEWWQRVVEVEPADWRSWAKIVQCCQSTGDLKRLNDARARVVALAEKMNLKMYCRDQFGYNGHPVFGIEYLKHNVTNGTDVSYSFVVRADQGETVQLRYTLSETPSDTQIGRELKQLKPDEHVYAIDLYSKQNIIRKDDGAASVSPSGVEKQVLIRLFHATEPPPYETVKKIVVEDLAKRVSIDK